MVNSKASRNVKVPAEEVIRVNFPRLVSLDELEAMFRETTCKREVEFSQDTNYTSTVVRGFPLHRYLSSCQGRVSCKDPLGFVFFDAEIQRIIYDNIPKYEIEALKFYVTNRGNEVMGNPDVARLVGEDITRYFVEHPIRV